MINKDLPRINRLMIIGTLYLFIMFCRASDISAITYILLRSSQRNQTFLYSLWIPARVKINSHTKKLWKSALQKLSENMQIWSRDSIKFCIALKAD
jgi:hypothetical protein